MSNFIGADLFGVTLGNLSEFQVIAIFLIAIIAIMLIQLVVFGALLSRLLKKSNQKGKDIYNITNNYQSGAAAPVIVPTVAPVVAPVVAASVAEEVKEEAPAVEETKEEAPVEQPVAAPVPVALDEIEDEEEIQETAEEQEAEEEPVEEAEAVEEIEEIAEQEEVVEEEPEEENVEEEQEEEPAEEVAAVEAVEEVVEEAVEETVEEPVQEPVQEETSEEDDEDDEDEDDEDDEDEDEEEEEDDEDEDGVSAEAEGEVIGGEKVYRPRYTYPVKLKLSNDTVKAFYTELKNEFLSYGIKSRISKTKENFNFSRDNIARLCIRGKTMKLYIALDPNTLDRDYFHHRDASEKKTYAHIPTMVRIKSRKSVAKSKELIAALAQLLELKKKRRFQPKDFSEDLSPVGLTFIEKKGYGYLMKQQGVTLETVEQLPDELSARFVQKSEGRLMSRYIKTSVTLGELASRFNDGDTVNIDAIKASGIGSKNANYLIVEDGQSIDKKLKVYADEFSPNAIKMIALAGGEVFKLERK